MAIQRQHWTVVGASLVSFLIGTASPAVLSWIKHGDDRNDHVDQLSDGERDYVLHVIELQSKASPEEAQAIAALTNVATGSYLREPSFSKRFADAITDYALNISGAKASQDARKAADEGAPPNSIAAAAALGQAQAAAVIVQTAGIGAGQPSAVAQAALQPAKGRVFFQVARQDDLATANAINGQLTTALGATLNPVSGVEVVPRFTGPTQLRYFFRADKAAAQQIASALSGALPAISCRYVAGYEVAGKAKPQLFELWLTPGATAMGAVRSGAGTIPC